MNFCKFTNETRNGIEDATANSGQTWIAALNGTASGGGYELALACEHIMLVDDRSSAVSLPELPLLGVLPGTGGLTRVVDKRHVRRDLADYFSTRPEGVTGKKAAAWRLVDEVVPRTAWAQTVTDRARERAAAEPRPADAQGIKLTPLAKDRSANAIQYRYVSAKLDPARGVAEITIAGPEDDPPASTEGIHAQGDQFWILAMTRELDDLILDLRTNEPELGTWVLRTKGDPEKVLAHDRLLQRQPKPNRLASPRDHRLPQAHPQAPGRHQPQPDRADRARQLLRRLAPGAGPGRGPQLPAGRAQRRRRPRHRARHHHHQHDEPGPPPHGQRPDPPPDPLPRR